jgi:hypothetical protein
MRARYTSLALICFAWSSISIAELYRTPIYRDVRWLGRADTGVALISDGSAAFYNPGGLGRNEAFRFSLLNPMLGANRNIYDSAMAFMSSSPQSISEYLDPFMGVPLAAQANYFPHIQMPNFMVGYFIANSQSMKLTNPVSPSLNIDYRYDRGVILGGGVDIQKKLFLGASLRYHKRSMIKDVLGGATITNASLESLLENLTLGEGWGLNLGAQFRHEISETQALNFGVAVQDLGRTTFRSQVLETGAPLTQATYTSVGVAYTGQVPGLSYAVLVDVNNLGQYDESYSKKVQLGAEVAIPGFTFRGGMHQGYWTAGLSTSVLPFLSIDLATYGEELGVAGGQDDNRYYMLGLNIGLDLEHKKRRKQKYTLDHL